MSVNIQERLTTLFEKVTDGNLRFEKKMYPKVFAKVYEEYQDVFEEITRVVDASEDRESLIREIAEYIPHYMTEKVDMSLSKRKKDLILLDYNLGMATFILPLLNYNETDACKQIGEEMLSIWNETFSTQLKNSNYEQISDGFKQRLCYITTAVCKSFGKPDDCYELETLRNYRDQYLLEEGNGTELVREYYNTAPTIVKRIDQLENSSEIYQKIWSDYLMLCIQLIEADKKEDCKEVYSSMVRELQKKYLYS